MGSRRAVRSVLRREYASTVADRRAPNGCEGQIEDAHQVRSPRRPHAPQAITDDVHYDNRIEMIDRLMASGKLTKGQKLYM